MHSRLNTFAFLVIGVAALLLSPGCASVDARRPTDRPEASAEGRRPNLVLVFTDDQRADTLGCAGHPFIETPHLDRLAREGARFENAFVITSLCCPSRATVLTGRYTHQTNVSHNRMDVDYGLDTYLPRLLQAAGYATAFIGKYHLGADGRPRPGFDHWVAYVDYEGHGKYFGASINVDGRELEVDGHSTDELVARAVAWLREVRDRPFFLILSLKNPHLPMEPPERHASLYDGLEIEMPASYDDPADRLPRPVRERTRTRRIETTLAAMDDVVDAPREFVRRYSRMIPGIDDAVGAVYDALAAEELLDRTAILFSSDNGMLLGEHGLLRKGLAYDPSVRVPLILRYPPRIAAGTRVAEQVLNLDIPPTILDIAGLRVPRAMEGESLLPLAGGQARRWRDAWLFLGHYEAGSRPALISVRTERWKYSRYVEGGVEEELFDLGSDPDERTNLAGRVLFEPRLRDMRRLTRTIMRRLDVPRAWLDPLPRASGDDPDD